MTYEHITALCILQKHARSYVGTDSHAVTCFKARSDAGRSTRRVWKTVSWVDARPIDAESTDSDGTSCLMRKLSSNPHLDKLLSYHVPNGPNVDACQFDTIIIDQIRSCLLHRLIKARQHSSDSSSQQEQSRSEKADQLLLVTQSRQRKTTPNHDGNGMIR